jgi:hypothetical protein
VNYQLQVGTTPIPVDGGSAINYSAYITTADVPLTVSDITSGTTVVHHLEWNTPVEGLRTTFSGLHTSFKGTATGDLADSTRVNADWKFDALHRYTFGLEYTYNNLILAGEYQLEDHTVMANYNNPAQQNFDSKQEMDSWYISATYRFTDWFELGGYYSEIYADRKHRDGSTFAEFGLSAPWQTWQKEKVLTLRFDPLPNLVFKVEGHLIDGIWNMSESTDASKKDWYLFATKATVSF